MVDIFDEVNEDLRADRAQALLARYGIAIVAAIVLAVVGVGIWQAWDWNQGRRSQQIAEIYFSGMRLADQPGTGTEAHKQAVAIFAQLADGRHEGYRTLARLREAALQWDAGQQAAALGLWDQVAMDGRADKLLRGLATLLWAQHQLDHGDPAQITPRLQSLTGADDPWHALAAESLALLDLRAGKTDQARAAFKTLANDGTAPQGVRTRAGVLLAGLGG